MSNKTLFYQHITYLTQLDQERETCPSPNCSTEFDVHVNPELMDEENGRRGWALIPDALSWHKRAGLSAQRHRTVHCVSSPPTALRRACGTVHIPHRQRGVLLMSACRPDAVPIVAFSPDAGATSRLGGRAVSWQGGRDSSWPLASPPLLCGAF